jgi:hypothetical protein
MTFAAAFVVGAALLALWLDWRFDGRRPTSLTHRIVHAMAACVVLRLAFSAGDQLVGASSSPQQRLMMLFALVLPCLIYTLLAGLWLVRTLAEVSRLAGR